jgi:single-strand selective monofunctional uracil DNA glycosylase
MRIPTESAESMGAIVDSLVNGMDSLEFAPPVKWVYNPLVYARKSYDAYCRAYGSGSKEVLLVGMNPGPWGMAQTGIPFGDPEMVKDWLQLRVPVSAPAHQHPKRPILGLESSRGEVSGKRLWGWARQRFGSPHRFFNRFWVANYCPLIFMEASGRNRTPDKLPKIEKTPLFEACDRALYFTVRLVKPRFVIGVGKFAEDRVRSAVGGMGVNVGRITHPSPANPRANRGWSEHVERELRALGVML